MYMYVVIAEYFPSPNQWEKKYIKKKIIKKALFFGAVLVDQNVAL